MRGWKLHQDGPGAVLCYFRLRHSPRYEGMETVVIMVIVSFADWGLRHSPRYEGMETRVQVRLDTHLRRRV